MAEESEGQEAGAEASGAGVDPAAVALALGGASREKADAFLEEQRSLAANQSALVTDQRHHLREQFKQLRLSIWQQRMGVLLRVATGFVGLAVAGFFSWMVWNAYDSGGVIIEPFSVPADLAAKGLTGQVVASRVLDDLVTMQKQTTSARDPKTYVNDWGDDIRVEIPETGISLMELQRYLREMLGHTTHITGEVVHSGTGLTMTARAGADSSGAIDGSEDEIGPLVQRAAEAIYGTTEPQRYSMYLLGRGRIAEAQAGFTALSKGNSVIDRAWAYTGLGFAVVETDGPDAMLRDEQASLDVLPDVITAAMSISTLHNIEGHPGLAVHDAQSAIAVLSKPAHGLVLSNLVSMYGEHLQAEVAALAGDFQKAMPLDQQVAATGRSSNLEDYATRLADDEIGVHQISAARTVMDRVGVQTGVNHNTKTFSDIVEKLDIDAAAEDWNAVLADDRAMTPVIAQAKVLQPLTLTQEAPMLALANAGLENFAAAEALISTTPGDCYGCEIIRARIAELQGQHGRAEYWFVRATAQEPSIPFAFAAWGEVLLERGQPDAAIAKFKLANQKGPHFADPLEGWGEALMKKNRSDLALAKFEEADKYAPNWGRLHMKWGEALGYAGSKDEAQKQFALAAGLDLSADDKAELAKVSHG